MTKSTIDTAIDALQALPEARQLEIAEALSSLAAAGAPVHTPEQLAAIDEGIADADAGRFVSDDEVAALFDRYRAA